MVQMVRLHELGGPEALTLDDLGVAEPSSSEIRVRMEAIGLNRADVVLTTGTYVLQPQLPITLGFEGAGYVTAVGSEVSNLVVGDYVSFIPAVTQFQYGT